MPDRIEEKLRTLQLDVDRVGLADSGAVRRRGERRTRNQALAAGLAVVAVVAGVVGVAGGLAGDRRAIEGPPAGEPSVSTKPEPVLSLTDDPLLDPAAIGRIGANTGWQRSPEPVGESLRQLRCIPSPLGVATARTEAAQYYTEVDGLIVEYALQFPSTAAAGRFTGELAETFAACDEGDPAEATVVDAGPEPVASGFRAARATTPTAAAGLSYYELGVNAKANIVVVLEWTSMGNPYGRDSTTWVWTADRLRLALDRAVSAAPPTF